MFVQKIKNQSYTTQQCKIHGTQVFFVLFWDWAVWIIRFIWFNFGAGEPHLRFHEFRIKLWFLVSCICYTQRDDAIFPHKISGNLWSFCVNSSLRESTVPHFPQWGKVVQLSQRHFRAYYVFISSASFSFEYGASTDPSALGGKRYCAGSTPGVLKKAHGLGLWG